ncbi:hypothetical protein A3B60_01315 [Candidatus Peregrinibacteria bacterium RIFCSPLOWO2_01_FULL_39_12]|nr:MAG: hypothetical protein A3B60_01315 [Candidatus Peregrinibacteria bacterium RIFCSPLOWO2_01_FULL_39_12]
MIKTCLVSGVQFEISDKDMAFYKKLGVPEPTLCPRERVRRRMAIRNERNLYRRKSSFSGDNIISAYHGDSACPVYTKDEWLSDKWDPMNYGIAIDFNKPFFEQFHELQKSVPRPALAVFTNAENADFCNYVGDVKNSYLCFGSIFIEDCMYGNPYYSKSCVDCFLIRKSEFCYECIDGESLYHCAYLQDCYECSDTYFSYDLKGCRNCFGCAALRKKQYCIFNQQYSKVDYDKSMAGFSFCDEAKVLETEKKLEELKLKSPRQAMMALNCENVTGNYIFNCKNCSDCFSISRNEDCNYNIQTVDNKDCYDMNYTEENELCYEYLGNYRNHTALFCAFPYGCHDIWYCDYVTNCKHCFGCVAIKNREYCILNKQYSKDEYFELKDRLVAMMKEGGEFGEFFPVNISPFAYNESVAYDYFPFTKEEVLKRGYRFRDEDKSEFQPTSYVPPVDIKDVPDSICNEILSCEISGRNYKITPAELKFYRLMKLPIPRKHFIERHKARLAKRLPYELFDRKCGKCGVEIKTAYKPDTVNGHSASLRVCCEKCYLETVY